MATAQLTPIGVSIRNVLIATDFSRCSSAAFHLGLQLSKAYNATAHIVFVLPNDPYLLAGPEAYVAARDAARRDLEDLESEVRRTYGEIPYDNYHLFLLDGEVADAILNFARQKEIDLIIMGTHGRSALPKALLGSVAERVYRHSPVPVLTLGPAVCRTAATGDPQSILVAASFTPASLRAVQFAAGLAHQHKSHLTLVHVLDPKTLSHVADRAAAEREAETRLREMLGGENQGLHCTVCVEVGSITQKIVEVARKQAADLLVMGVRRYGGVLDRLAIPHAYEIVRESPCPVLTLRETRTLD